MDSPFWQHYKHCPWYCLLIDQELISYRYWSCSCSCSSSFWATVFKKSQGTVFSNRIEMKLGKDISRWRPWRHCMQNCAAVWWMHTQRLPSVYTAASASSWSIVHSYLLLLPFILLLDLRYYKTQWSDWLCEPEGFAAGWGEVYRRRLACC